MQLSGSKIIPASPDKAFALLTNPEILMRTMPGLKRLTPSESGGYAAEMEMGVAAIKGKYQGHMQIHDEVVPESYRLVLDGQGPGGFVSVNMTVAFEPHENGTLVRYEGEANVGGTIASMGQRMIHGVANYLVNQFFTAIAKEAERDMVS
ncbi:MAG: carbon monoxide dehydrogenase [Sulfobacillus thermosulfidooxidans]|uniref:Carbon monoxide dehydrogenase n=1 Tax=Sulfobacillus thermosulfidooxidans TaxID=28034 RepID=A0A2T2WVW5_SULTH|nr:MAG: carbon monoxide dehydrogenase [Sulfobacillus thermosulfidooxidans]